MTLGRAASNGTIGGAGPMWRLKLGIKSHNRGGRIRIRDGEVKGQKSTSSGDCQGTQAGLLLVGDGDH